MEGTLMDFRFTISVEKHGARDVAENNSLALLGALEEVHPEAGAAVGADLDAGFLEATFCANGRSLDEATEKARRIFLEAATASGLGPVDFAGFVVEADLTRQALAS
jgi:hypothetical protein